MPIEDANLRCMISLQMEFNCKVGFSDHCSGLITSLVAVSLGASSIEKHITLDRTMYGSDQAASVEPHGFRKLVEWIRDIPNTLGDGHKLISDEERAIRTKLWRTNDIEIQ